jgi:MFS transporter, DHA1 family, inner membrane transport protein
MHSQLFLVALALGNFVVGLSILAPVGMLAELASHFGVSIGTAGLLISASAAVVCLSPPFVAWMTSRIDRRALLSAMVLSIAVGQTASALAPSFPALLAVQLAMLAFAGGFTPLAAGAAVLLVSEEKGAAAISSVLLGWALAIAAGLPLISLIVPHIGWRTTYVLIGVLAALSFLALLRSLPKGLQGKPIIFATWVEVGRSRDLVVLLLITCSIAIGQYVVIAFAGPLLMQLTNATPERIAAVFALFGVMTLVGNICASRVVQAWGAFRTSAVFMACMVFGVALWAFGTGIYLSMAAGAAIWGFGFAAVAAMQQVRLIMKAPSLATASVAINNTAVYFGQAIGAGIGGALFAGGNLRAMGFVALAPVTVSFGFLWLTRSMPDAPGPGSDRLSAPQPR